MLGRSLAFSNDRSTIQGSVSTRLLSFKTWEFHNWSFLTLWSSLKSLCGHFGSTSLAVAHFIVLQGSAGSLQAASLLKADGENLDSGTGERNFQCLCQ